MFDSPPIFDTAINSTARELCKLMRTIRPQGYFKPNGYIQRTTIMFDDMPYIRDTVDIELIYRFAHWVSTLRLRKDRWTFDGMCYTLTDTKTGYKYAPRNRNINTADMVISVIDNNNEPIDDFKVKPLSLSANAGYVYDYSQRLDMARVEIGKYEFRLDDFESGEMSLTDTESNQSLYCTVNGAKIVFELAHGDKFVISALGENICKLLFSLAYELDTDEANGKEM